MEHTAFSVKFSWPAHLTISTLPMVDHVDVEDFIRQFGKPSARILERTAVRQLMKITEVAKAYLFAACCSLVRNVVNGHACFTSYSSDGTPLLTSERFVKDLRGTKIRRRGRQLNEFLLERCCYQSFDIGGNLVTRTLFRDPLPLTSGTSALAQFACCMQWPSLREHGFKGLAVSHFVFDRACEEVSLDARC